MNFDSESEGNWTDDDSDEESTIPFFCNGPSSNRGVGSVYHYSPVLRSLEDAVVAMENLYAIQRLNVTEGDFLVELLNELIFYQSQNHRYTKANDRVAGRGSKPYFRGVSNITDHGKWMIKRKDLNRAQPTSIPHHQAGATKPQWFISLVHAMFKRYGGQERHLDLVRIHCFLWTKLGGMGWHVDYPGEHDNALYVVRLAISCGSDRAIRFSLHLRDCNKNKDHTTLRLGGSLCRMSKSTGDGVSIYATHPRLAGKVPLGFTDDQKKQQYYVQHKVERQMQGQSVSVIVDLPFVKGEDAMNLVESIKAGTFTFLPTEDISSLSPTKLIVPSAEQIGRIKDEVNKLSFVASPGSKICQMCRTKIACTFLKPAKRAASGKTFVLTHCGTCAFESAEASGLCYLTNPCMGLCGGDRIEDSNMIYCMECVKKRATTQKCKGCPTVGMDVFHGVVRAYCIDCIKKRAATQKCKSCGELGVAVNHQWCTKEECKKCHCR
jgi:hypothetical protein